VPGRDRCSASGPPFRVAIVTGTLPSRNVISFAILPSETDMSSEDVFALCGTLCAACCAGVCYDWLSLSQLAQLTIHTPPSYFPR
jgi:hypothetical protein